jgi:apolipoprotein N-acyltransferase
MLSPTIALRGPARLRSTARSPGRAGGGGIAAFHAIRCCWCRCQAGWSCWTQPAPLVAARRGWWFGLGHHVLGLYWVTEAILFEAARFWWLVPLAVPALAAALALFIAAACLLARCAPPGWPRVLALGGAWVLADLARQFVLTGFPWNPWGSVWEIPGAVGDVFIQPAHGSGARNHASDTVARGRAIPRVALARCGRGTARGLVHSAWFDCGGPFRRCVTVVRCRATSRRPSGTRTCRRIFAALDLTAGRASVPPACFWPEPRSWPARVDEARARRSADDRRAPRQSAAVLRWPARTGGCSRCSVAARSGGSHDKWHLVPFGVIRIGAAADHGDARQRLYASGLDCARLRRHRRPSARGHAARRSSAGIVAADARPGGNVPNDAWFKRSTSPRQHPRRRGCARWRRVCRCCARHRISAAAFDAPAMAKFDRVEMQTTGTLAVTLPGALPRTLFARFGLWLPAISGLVALGFGVMARRVAAHG